MTTLRVPGYRVIDHGENRIPLTKHSTQPEKLPGSAKAADRVLRPERLHPGLLACGEDREWSSQSDMEQQGVFRKVPAQ